MISVLKYKGGHSLVVSFHFVRFEPDEVDLGQSLKRQNSEHLSAGKSTQMF